MVGFMWCYYYINTLPSYYYHEAMIQWKWSMSVTDRTGSWMMDHGKKDPAARGQDSRSYVSVHGNY